MAVRNAENGSDLGQLGGTQSHGQCHHSIECILTSYSTLIETMCLSFTVLTNVKVLQYGLHLGSHDLLKFWEISASISERVQNRHTSYNGTLIGNHTCPIEWH